METYPYYRMITLENLKKNISPSEFTALLLYVMGGFNAGLLDQFWTRLAYLKHICTYIIIFDCGTKLKLFLY